MVNVAIFNLKDLLKFITKFIIVVFIIYITTSIYKYIEHMPVITYLDETIPALLYTNNKEDQIVEKFEKFEKNIDELSWIEYVLNSQLALNSSFKNNKDNKIEFEQAIVENKEENAINETVQTDVNTEIVSDNNIATNYTNQYKSVEIKNSSKYNLTEEILTPNIQIENKKDIIIFHTHTTESYTPSDKFPYQMTGSFRSIDLNFSVSRVGDELEKYLRQRDYNVFHDKTVNDYPEYTGSYNRSLKAVENDLKIHTGAEIVFDIHRDAVGSKSDYAPCVKIGEETAAQIMFVIGTDGGGLEHSNWQQNLKFAVKVQEKANELYPGLFRPIILRNSRYNQHLAKAASIIEVGATGNTLDQCLVSMKYLAYILDIVLKE